MPEPLDLDAEAGMIEELLERLHIHSPDYRIKAAALIGGAVALLAMKDGEEGLDGAISLLAHSAQEAAKRLGLARTYVPVTMLAGGLRTSMAELGDVAGVSAANEAFTAMVAEHCRRIAAGRTVQ